MNAAIRVSKELQGIARDLGKAIDTAAGEPVAFSLLVWTEGRCNYISNGPRADSVKAMRELLQAWEAGMPDVPAHEVS